MFGSSLFLAHASVFLLMVVLFLSCLYPVVILMCVRFATLGGFAGLAIVHQALHFVRRDGLGIEEGIQSAAGSRVRPIAMGILTSVGGMLSLVLISGSGSELYSVLGAVVLVGLVVSTIFTLGRQSGTAKRGGG